MHSSFSIKSNRITRGVAGVIALLLASLFFLTVSPASAATGTDYDGTNPATTGCSADGVTIASRTVTSGTQSAYLEIRYSPTCQTNWIRVTTDGSNQSAKAIGRDASGTLSAYTTPSQIDNGNSFSTQVYAPGTTCVNAYVNLYWGDSSRTFINDWHIC